MSARVSCAHDDVLIIVDARTALQAIDSRITPSHPFTRSPESEREALRSFPARLRRTDPFV